MDFIYYLVNVIKDVLTDRNNQAALTLIALFMMLSIVPCIELLIRRSFSSFMIFLVLIGYFAFSLWMIFPLEKQYLDFLQEMYSPLDRLP